MADQVLAATKWNTNADLILDLATLGYLKPTDNILDPTYGRGIWWKKWKPLDGSIYVNQKAWDFRNPPSSLGLFDVIAFDPPYIATGGKKTSTLDDFNSGYGLHDEGTETPAILQNNINRGISALKSHLKSRKLMLVKCMDYVSSGKLWIGTHYTLTHALSEGFTLVDRFEHVGDVRAQPPGRRQVHARRNLSTMFVFRGPK